MRSREEIHEACSRILTGIDSDGAELLYSANDKALTRFANNTIHQNMQQSIERIDLRVLVDGRTGKASANSFDDNAVKRMVAQAIEAAGAGAKDDNPLPMLEAGKYATVDAYCQKTADLSPQSRAEKVAQAVSACEKNGLEASGIFSNEANVSAIVNSAGLFAHQPETSTTFSISVASDDSSGWGESVGVSVDKLEIEADIEKAVKLALDSRKPTDIEPGEYTVVLPPEAAFCFMPFLGFRAFNGLLFAEGRSALSGKLGKKFFGGNISIKDDFSHPLQKGMPFDYEGMPRQVVPLVENGKVKAVTHDRRTARMCAAESTGHSLPVPSSWGALPFNMVIEAGDSDLEEMIASTENGLFVTHFHYTNVVDPMKMLITGMTRDGVFRIREGKIAEPVRNLRFTESAFKAYSNVDMLGIEQKRISMGYGGAFVAPAMRIDNFNFSSVTEF